MPALDFEVKPDDAEPVSFRVHGTGLDGVAWSEEFTCVHPIPAGAINHFVQAVGIDEQGNQQSSAPNVQRLIEKVLRDHKVNGDGKLEPADDTERFHALLNDKVRIVDYPTLAKIAGKIMEAATERPLG